ncbi:hypothetical protein B0T17DRAFT_516654 [Bombardia bombarda]|uniref:rRNA methyltransferase 1, mitochondrial n=1 Tax=Bombardia bombarda TaxID=252184 RepID=A0AA39XLN6_9PEZI|nr:hypothetical protein B0T17DRAFT_516654 [Bombardia bombarda]
MTLSMLCRTARPTLLARSTPTGAIIFPSKRPASLSSIHKGLRRSQKAQSRVPARSPRPSFASGEGMSEERPKPMTYAQRQAARKAAEQEKPDFKIRKGKKDITEYPDKAPKAKTRASLFFDPESNFGKKSLVYQVKAQLQSKDQGSAPEKRAGRSKPAFSRSPPSSSSRPSWPEFSEKPSSASARSSDLRTTLDLSGFDDGPRGGDSRSSGDRKSFGASRRFGVSASRGSATRGRNHGGVGRTSSARELVFNAPRISDDAPSRDPANKDAPSEEASGRGDRPTFRERKAYGAARGGGLRDAGRDARPRGASFPSRDSVSFRGRDDSARPSSSTSSASLESPLGGASESTPEVWDLPKGFAKPAASRASIELPSRPQYKVTRVGSGPSFGDSHPHFKDPNQPISVPYTTAASQFLYGKSVVEAALQSARRRLYKLYIYSGTNRQNVTQDFAVEKLARRRGIETVIVGDDGLRLMDKMSGSRPHNGYVLEASPLPQLPVTGLGPMSTSEEDGGGSGYQVNLGHQSAEEAAINGASNFIESSSTTHKPLVVVLDQVLDPGNLGAILRTVSFLGTTAVAITKRNSASLTPVALKASAGASEALTLFSLDSLPHFLAESRENGWEVYAAVPQTLSSSSQRHIDMHDVEDLDPLSKKPCILVMGSEGEGLSKVVKSKADFEVNIPNLSGANVIDSLNVSVAAGLLCSAFLKGQVKSQFTLVKEEEKKGALW